MSEEARFKVGQRVRLLVDIWDDGADHHPACYLAHAGEVLIVRRVGGGYTFPVAVSHEDITDRSFGVARDEIEPVTARANGGDKAEGEKKDEEAAGSE